MSDNTQNIEGKRFVIAKLCKYGSNCQNIPSKKHQLDGRVPIDDCNFLHPNQKIETGYCTEFGVLIRPRKCENGKKCEDRDNCTGAHGVCELARYCRYGRECPFMTTPGRGKNGKEGTLCDFDHTNTTAAPKRYSREEMEEYDEEEPPQRRARPALTKPHLPVPTANQFMPLQSSGKSWSEREDDGEVYGEPGPETFDDGTLVTPPLPIQPNVAAMQQAVAPFKVDLTKDLLEAKKTEAEIAAAAKAKAEADAEAAAKIAKEAKTAWNKARTNVVKANTVVAKATVAAIEAANVPVPIPAVLPPKAPTPGPWKNRDGPSFGGFEGVNFQPPAPIAVKAPEAKKLTLKDAIAILDSYAMIMVQEKRKDEVMEAMKAADIIAKLIESADARKAAVPAHN